MDRRVAEVAMKMLQGLALKNFRGIGAKFLEVAPFGRINFFIGPNNSGKSTVLLFISKYLSGQVVGRSAANNYDSTEIRLGSNGSQPEFKISIKKSEIHQRLADKSERLQRFFKVVLDRIADEDVIWISARDGFANFSMEFDPDDMEGSFNHMDWRNVWHELTNQSGGSVQAWINQSLKVLVDLVHSGFDECYFIPAIRQISNSGSQYDDMSGKGLIDKLAELQNPSYTEREKKAVFDKINEFLRAVTSSAEAQIEIPFNRQHILVHIDGKVLPLSSLGTGIHEVIMIASFCTLTNDRILCIEEPEIHLHPILQRKLISYLEKETSNQYFIATHSASILDAVDASIYSVNNVSGETFIQRVSSGGERFEICKRLGYHASDLLQSNAVIWVEGPSDRIYLRHWISSCDPNLVEGVHYSIMFYGGRLLSHLSFDDPEVDEFINLRRLNRNSVVMIDSDKKSALAKINNTKKRVQKELGEEHCWITKGREIENYVPEGLMKTALSVVYGDKFDEIADTSQYEHRLFFKTPKGDVFENVDKVKVALEVCALEADLSELDLKNRIEKVVAFIRDANPIH